MSLSLLTQDPWLFLIFVIAFLLTLSVHECSHAFMSFLLGDPTAKREGRLTLNPLAHVDFIGFLALVTVGFGWGKPVPFNPYNLKYPKWGPTLVAAAGPASNLVFGVICILLSSALLRFAHLADTNLLIMLLTFMGYLNFLLMVFNLIPLPPLDGSKALLGALSAERYRHTRQMIEQYGPMMLLGLIFLDAVLHVGIFHWITSVAQFCVGLIASLVGA